MKFLLSAEVRGRNVCTTAADGGGNAAVKQEKFYRKTGCGQFHNRENLRQKVDAVT